MMIILALISVVSCQGDVWEELFSFNSLKPVSLDVFSEIPVSTLSNELPVDKCETLMLFPCSYSFE